MENNRADTRPTDMRVGFQASAYSSRVRGYWQRGMLVTRNEIGAMQSVTGSPYRIRVDWT